MGGRTFVRRGWRVFRKAPARPSYNKERAGLSNRRYGAYGTHRAVSQTAVWGDPYEFTDLFAAFKDDPKAFSMCPGQSLFQPWRSGLLTGRLLLL